MKRNNNEDRFQSYVCGVLERLNIEYFMIPNGQKRSPYEQAQFKRMGGKAGVSDLELLLPGGCPLFVEVKFGKGKQSEKQVAWQNSVEMLGYEYFLVRPENLDDLVLKITKRK